VKSKQGLDRAKAAKLFIDNYYSNLLKQRAEREARYVSCINTVVFVWLRSVCGTVRRDLLAPNGTCVPRNVSTC